MKCDILLVALPLLWGQEYRRDMRPPVNLLCLTSFLREKGFTSGLIDCVSEDLTIDELLKRIALSGPRFVGIPCYHASLSTAEEFIRRLRDCLPGVRIIGGGPSVSIEPEEILRTAALECAVIGEGEETLEEVLGTSSSEEYGEIEGLVFSSGGDIRRTDRRSPIRDLDRLPFIDYSVLDMGTYFSSQKLRDVPPTVFMTTSRGCSHRCSFCATPLLWPGPVRRFTAARVIEEMKYQSGRFEGAHIGFLDDCFFSDAIWLQEFLQKVSPLGITYNCIGRIDRLNPDTIEALVKTGCGFIAFGVETGSQRRQKAIGKNLDLRNVLQNVALLSKFDIVAKGFFMLGFPDETPEEMAETINFAVTLRRKGMKKFSIFPVIIYPGTELARKFSITRFDSSICKDYPRDLSSLDDFGEKNLALYSTVPATDVNRYLSHQKIIKLVKLAYNRIEQMEYIKQGEILSL